MIKNNLTWAFFGTSRFSVILLEELKTKGFLPKLIVTTEDKPKGRKLVLSASEVKVWAEKEGIDYLQLKSLKKPESLEEIKSHCPSGFDVFIVASYGKIIPQEIIDLPKYKTLNVHPSLLPKLRGPSPLQSAILTEDETGVTIIRLDSEMDHGPILAQEKISIEWPPYFEDLEKASAILGAEMLENILPKWIDGKVKEIEQDHTKATICQKIEKSEAELNMGDSPEINLRKIRAYQTWPGAYFFDKNGDKKTRVIIKRAHIENGELILDKVLPEGKKEMDYTSYVNGKRSTLTN